MLKITQIEEKDFYLLVDWNNGKDEDYLIQWAGSKIYHFPLTIDQVKTHSKDEFSKIFIIYNDNIPIGSVELHQINKETLSANVCRFILSEDVKNKGYGTIALKQLSDIAFNEMGLKSLVLRVFCYNVGAIRCYEKAGFLVKEYNKGNIPDYNSYTMELKYNSN